MANLYLGRTAPDATPGFAALAKAFAANGLPEARTAVARRVLAEIASPKRLAQTTEDELKALKAITLRLVMGPPVLMPHEDIVTAVNDPLQALRSPRQHRRLAERHARGRPQGRTAARA